MKILVTGANGQLGSEMRVLSLSYNTFEWVFADKKQLNLADLINLESKLDVISPDLIINSAAYTNVANAENERKITNSINNHAVSIIAKWSFDNKVKLIHFSSDYVYPGNTRNPLKESDITNPVNYYGLTKLLGEKKCLSNNPSSIVIRTSGNFSIYGNNFVKTMLKKMKNEKTINVVKDQIFSPTYVKDLALAIMFILNNKIWISGIYNYSNLGKTSWYDFAIDIRSIGGFQCSINPVSLFDFSPDLKRPKFTLLDKNKIIKTFSISIPHYKLGLEKCIKNIINEK